MSLRSLAVLCIAFSVPVLLAPAAGAAPATHTIAVDCAHGKSIQQALAHPAEQLTIEISGFCQERVVIERSNVTLIGTDPATDGITGPAVDDVPVQRALVRVLDSRNVRFENLTITGSEARGLEGHFFAGVTVVNCRIVENGLRGIQMNNDSFANVEDSVIADNDNIDLVTFNAGLISCTRCTVSDDVGFLVAAIRGAVIVAEDSTFTTGGAVGVLAAERSTVFAQGSDATAAFVPLYASEDSQLYWNGGTVAGSIWTDFTSQSFLQGVTQTANPIGNRTSEASHLAITGGSFVGDTHLSGFSNGTAEGAPTFDTITCDRGGNLFCDGSEAKTASAGCALCP